MNYVEKCKIIIDKLVADEAEAVKSFIATEIQAPTWEELNNLAFEQMLKETKKLEAEAGLNGNLS